MAASPDDLILITGSLYVAGEARAIFFSLSSRANRTGALSGLKG